MSHSGRKTAKRVQWVDPSGQRMTLDAPSGGEILLQIEHGAVTIEAMDCILTEHALPGVMPEVRRRVDDQLITVPLQTCVITGQRAAKTPEPSEAPAPSGDKYDLFISHASEDKDLIARPLYEALTKRGLAVWFDEAELTLGDSLRRKIDRGLALCRFGIVIISPEFLAKEWPQRELDGLLARETATGEKAVLPIWHKIDATTVLRYSPTLADRLAANTAEGIVPTVEKIMKAMRK